MNKLVLVLIVLAGCGDDEGGGARPNAPPPAAAAAMSPPAKWKRSFVCAISPHFAVTRELTVSTTRADRHRFVGR
jgi:hypothetical protein